MKGPQKVRRRKIDVQLRKTFSGLKNLETLHLKGNPVLENKSRDEIMEVLSGADNLTEIDF